MQAQPCSGGSVAHLCFNQTLPPFSSFSERRMGETGRVQVLVGASVSGAHRVYSVCFSAAQGGAKQEGRTESHFY